MDKILLREIILEQKDLVSRKEKDVSREVLPFIEKCLALPHVVVISGIRRCGKSTLLAQIMRKYYQNDVYYFNFEDERLVDFRSNDLNDLYEVFVELYGEKKVFFFDEVQNILGWERFVRRMYDRGFKFFITGSNASLLSRELGTKLTARHVSISLYPFSFLEFMTFKGYRPSHDALSLTKERGKIKGFFQEYLKMGGMPEFLKYREREILQGTYNDIIYRDILVRYGIKEEKAFRELCFYLLSHAGGLFTYNKLKQILNLGSVNTVKSYVDYCENSYLVHTLNLFSFSLAQQILTPKKAYGIDNGFLRLLSFRFSENRGRFLENMVLVELLRRGLGEVYYFKNEKGWEVDFLVKKKTKVTRLIQVTESLREVAVREREIRALGDALSKFKLSEGLILTEDEEQLLRWEGKRIRILPVYKWLLSKNEWLAV